MNEKRAKYMLALPLHLQLEPARYTSSRFLHQTIFLIHLPNFIYFILILQFGFNFVYYNCRKQL